MFNLFVPIETGTQTIYVNPANVFAVTPHPSGEIGQCVIIATGGAAVQCRGVAKDIAMTLRDAKHGN